MPNPGSMATDRHVEIEEALERIEETILPSMSMMLDTLIETASLARSGVDAEDHAAELRALGLQLDSLTRQIEAVVPAEVPAAVEARICA